MEHRGIPWNTRDMFHCGCPPRLWNMRGARHWSPNADLLEDLRLLLQSVSNPSFSYLLAVPLSKVRNNLLRLSVPTLIPETQFVTVAGPTAPFGQKVHQYRQFCRYGPAP